MHETGVNDEENLRRRLGDEKRSLFRDRITARKGERETRLYGPEETTAFVRKLTKRQLISVI